MNRVGLGLAAATLAGVAGSCAFAASPGAKEPAATRVDSELAQPAPVPGTFDFQLARLDAARAHAGVAAPPAPAAFDPATPNVGVARRFVDAAWAFDAYTRRAGALDGAFEDGAGVSRAVATSAGYEASQLAEGAIAWGALAALQDAGFVDAVRQAAPDAASRDALAADLLARPAAVLRLPGAREAALRVSDLVGARGDRLVQAGAAVKKASYGIQKAAWARTSLDKPADRLAAVKTLGARRASADEGDTAELMKAVTALRPAAGQSRAAPEDWRPTPAVARSVALAALALLGRAGEDRAPEAATLLATAQGEDCLKMAKLNLHQCLAVAGPRYEDMFCLGQHAVADTGRCLVSTAGWTPPPAPAPAAPARLIAAAASVPAPLPAAASPPVPAAIAVPIALAALDGPERAVALAPPAAAAGLPAASESEATLPPPVLAPDPRPRWARQTVDEDEADWAPAPRRPPAAAEDEDGDAPPAPRAARARYADVRYDRRSVRDAPDEEGDEDAPPPPRPAPPRLSPGYPAPGYGPAYGYGSAYGYGPGYWSGGYGPGAR